MIWLLQQNIHNCKFKQFFDKKLEDTDSFIILENKPNDDNTKYNKLTMNIYQTDNIIMYEVDNNIYCYEYTEVYKDNYIEYTYKLTNKHKMPILKNQYYYFCAENQIVNYKVNNNLLYIKTNDTQFTIEII